MEKFIHLSVSNLRLDDLAGLSSETVTLATPHADDLGAVAAAKLATLTDSLAAMQARMDINRKSFLTAQIAQRDSTRDALFTELKRTVKTATQSSVAETRTAGEAFMRILAPFWDINTEPMASQTAQIDLFFERYVADPAAIAAVTTLNLILVLHNLRYNNDQLKTLYAQRLAEEAAIEGPSASSLKKALVLAYDDFCTAIEITLSATPSAILQNLFYDMNNVRRKYIRRLPTPLDDVHTSVAPIPVQVYTGKPVTPLPRVFFQTGKETVELVFAQDFDVTYKNNTEVGEAKLSVHGKGKYTGRYDTTFHIART
jgi:hypothetical protein